MQLYKKSLHNYPKLLSLTTLQPEEFMEVLSYFTPLWQAYYQRYDLQGKPRCLPKFDEHASISLSGSGEKLFFILLYLKQNPTQEYQAAMFGMSQSKVSQWVAVLLPILQKALARMHALPYEHSDKFYYTLQAIAGYLLCLDATERPIPRSTDYERQQYEYSGKKKCHTVKNNLITDHQGNILYLSDTYPGSIHDKTIADEMDCHFAEGGLLLEDLGYLGYEPEGVSVLLPIKKKKNTPLSKEDKRYNRLLAQVRVTIEHVNSGVKRLRIVKEKIRLKREGIRHTVMQIACGLHNLRNRFRKLS